VSDYAVVDQIRRSIDFALFPWHADFTIAKAELPVEVHESDRIFRTEVTVVPAAILAHWPLAQS
jgi:hypothetical protein